MSTSLILLSQYAYDPLDRLTACSPANLEPHRRFYCKKRLATEIQGAIAHSIFQADDWRLAQQRRQGAGRETNLLAMDSQGSVLQALDGAQRQAMTYSPYGGQTPTSGLSSVLGFNGERPDPVTGHYLLGNGYRAFNPVLMRFNSPDSLSPFGKGGINVYAYCGLNPVGNIDPTGHFYWRLAAFAVGGVLVVGSSIGGIALGGTAGQVLGIAGPITGFAVMGSIFLNPGGARTVSSASITRRGWDIVQGGGTQPNVGWRTPTGPRPSVLEGGGSFSYHQQPSTQPRSSSIASSTSSSPMPSAPPAVSTPLTPPPSYSKATATATATATKLPPPTYDQAKQLRQGVTPSIT
ncbi:RHS repeat-associated core domain-containing protein [Pseudomonas asplenii]|nr:RHS repeat-associated core domain-containing protein [Pseudomonas fuscovaginae]